MTDWTKKNEARKLARKECDRRTFLEARRMRRIYEGAFAREPKNRVADMFIGTGAWAQGEDVE